MAAWQGDEFGLIARFFRPLAAGTPGALGLTDDAAVFGVGADEEVVITTDALVAGVHFLADDPADLVARKALRTNLSDLAAMGAVPLGYTLALVLPAPVDADWLAGLAAGLAADQAEFGIGLLGGDTTSTPGPLTLSITALGRVQRGRYLSRGGARPGDDVWVSGPIGDAWLGLQILQGRMDAVDEAARTELVGRYRLPVPRLALGRRLVGVATAALDVSDGLVADLGHLCDVSRLDATIALDRVPQSAAARRQVRNDQRLALSLLAGGDDYELVFTAPPEAAQAVTAIAGELGLAASRIGQTAGVADGQPRVRVIDAAGRPLEAGDGGWQHFGNGRRE
ncbi:MAG: thiamine-phosphate kinase [Alphaproteobacteria bacterium]